MNRRLHRVPLLWHVSYATRERAGLGFVLDLHVDGCRVAGGLPVKVAMRLHLCLWPNQYPKETLEAKGVVKWTYGQQFGLAFDTPQVSVDTLLKRMISASESDTDRDHHYRRCVQDPD